MRVDRVQCVWLIRHHRWLRVSFICISMETEVMCGNNYSKRGEHVQKQDGAKNGTLWHTTMEAHMKTTGHQSFQKADLNR